MVAKATIGQAYSLRKPIVTILPDTREETRNQLIVAKITHISKGRGIQIKWHSQTEYARPQLRERTGVWQWALRDPRRTVGGAHQILSMGLLLNFRLSA